MARSKKEEIKEMVHQLAILAARWRSLHSQDRFEAAQNAVEEYHSIFKRLWSLGWNGDDLLPDEELPTRLMPDYFLEYWSEK